MTEGCSCVDVIHFEEKMDNCSRARVPKDCVSRNLNVGEGFSSKDQRMTGIFFA